MISRTAWLAVLIGLGIVLPIEIARLQTAIGSEAGWLGWFTVFHPDTTWPLFAFLLLPLAWGIRRKRTSKPASANSVWTTWFGESTKPGPDTTRSDRTRALVLACLPALLSGMISASIGNTPVRLADSASRQTIPLRELPPAWHDEYSYRFQARTFLAGRLAYPSHPRYPELFDQMHVLNDNGVYASRYFPGPGLWMAPFVLSGRPFWAFWLAGGLSAAFVFFIGRELAGNGVGLLAGLFAAVSPGIQLFAQHLLAHHPAMLGLTFFTWMFLRTMRTRSRLNAGLAGTGLIFAALCRPMTAAGVGLPFGIWLLIWWIRGRRDFEDRDDVEETFSRRSVLIACLGIPIVLGIGGMLVYNNRLTGDPLLTPYQRYTEIYTPRHAYGFNNVRRAAGNTSDKILRNYDQWAENLTPRLAIENVKKRVVASGQWVLALVPLAMTVGVFPFLAGRMVAVPFVSDRRWWLILASVLCLHLAHVPYWYAGIRNWHYVFESAPYLVLIAAGVTGIFLHEWWKEGRVGLVFWCLGFLGLSLQATYGLLPGDAQSSRVQSALNEDIWARRNYAHFNRLIDRAVTDRPALVLVADNPADRHIDFVTNRPPLDSAVIRGRFRPEHVSPAQGLISFPDRSVYAVVLNPHAETGIQEGKHSSVRWQRIAKESLATGHVSIYRLRAKRN